MRGFLEHRIEAIRCGSPQSLLVRHPRQSRWLDEWDRLKGGRSCYVSRCQRVWAPALPLKASLFVCTLLITNICAYLLQFKANSRDGIPSRPEVLAREIALSSTKLPGNGNRTFPFQKANHGSH